MCWRGSTVEQLTCNQQVVGSIPIASSILNAVVAELADAPDLGSGAQCVGVQVPPTAPLRGSGSVVEHRLAKARVAGSNPVFRSKNAVA